MIVGLHFIGQEGLVDEYFPLRQERLHSFYYFVCHSRWNSTTNKGCHKGMWHLCLHACYGSTGVFPIQSLQQAIKSDILSRGSIFHDDDAISKSHPSGMSPSNTGNIISLSYCWMVNGIVGLIGAAHSRHSSNRYTLFIIYREINREPESQFAAF